MDNPGPARPFRFIAPVPRWNGDLRAWRAEVRRIEDLGFATISISDHLAGGWALDPFVALQAAADSSESLRLLTLVLNTDLRHPVLVHRAAANLDVFSDGRLELGVGAGWLAGDYEVLGTPFEPPDVRIDRLAESVAVLKALFAGEEVCHVGEHHAVRGLTGVPSTVQQPRPPLLIGGGGPRMLDLAAREADIVSVHPRLKSGRLDHAAVADLSAASIARKVSRVRTTATAAGRNPDDLELQFSVFHCQVGKAEGLGPRASSYARLLEEAPQVLADSPSVLRGSVDECIDLLVRRREEFGFSYLNLGGDLDAIAPIVEALAGR
ncbi:TIGR03621 family F420-dependent LLM class oxidoreductase [Geodermatophilus sp. SYSU D00758]